MIINSCSNEYSINSYYNSSNIENQYLDNQEVIKVKKEELKNRAFTTFSLENWNNTYLDSLQKLAREINTKFETHRSNQYGNGFGDRNETDSYNQNTSFISRAFVAGSPEIGFRVITKESNPFAEKSEQLLKEPLVTSVLSHIFKLLPDEMRPEKDRIEISLIRQTASSMPELFLHRDLRRQVFVLVVNCNFNEGDGGYLSVKDTNKFPFSGYGTTVNEKNSSFHEQHMTSTKGNGYLIRENTDSSPGTRFYVQHRRGPFSTKVENPERITLRILIDSQNKPATEAI